MKTLVALVVVFMALVGMSGCIFIADGNGHWEKGSCSNGIEYKSPELVELRQANTSAIASRLNIGMTEPEVRAAFIERVARAELGKDKGILQVNNPYRTETVYCQDKVAKVLWYYSAVKRDNDRIDQDELTPVLIVDDRVAGWGQRFYEQYCKKVQPPQLPKP